MYAMKKKHPLRRVILSTAATVSGIVLLLALKQPADGSASAAAQAPAPSAPVASASPSESASGASNDKAHAQGSEGSEQDTGSADAQASAAPSKSAAKAPAAAAKTFTGDSVSAQYGAVQVKLTVKDGKVTAAQAVQGPSTGPGGTAIPTLNQEVVSAQSAGIDAVSGATFTSEGYKKSLQSAIDKAGL